MRYALAFVLVLTGVLPSITAVAAESRDRALAGFHDLQGRGAYQPVVHEHNGRWIAYVGLHSGAAANPLTGQREDNGTLLVDVTDPAKPRSSIRPKRITAHIASLKWSRPDYAEQLRATMGAGVDYLRRPSEDFARATIEYADETGRTLVGEVTTSWSFVGAGLRLSAELLGPEYSFALNTLNTSAQLFLSRRVQGAAGEDLVEKQNAEMGLMPVVGNEAAEYGYENENRHFTDCFRRGVAPALTFDDGLEVVEILMTAYMSAELGRTLEFRPPGLDTFVPAVAQGTWRPGGA